MRIEAILEAAAAAAADMQRRMDELREGAAQEADLLWRQVEEEQQVN